MPKLLSSRPGSFPKRALIGVYDEEILCDACESRFGSVDSYGIDVLLKEFEKYFSPFMSGCKAVAQVSMEADKNRILQFLIAVLWRASVSTHSFYSKVDLGPHGSSALAAALGSSCGISTIFDAVLSRWEDTAESTPTTAFLDPAPERWNGVNAYRLYLGRIVAYVKVDARPFPVGLRHSSLVHAPALVIVERNMEKSKDLRAMRRTAAANAPRTK